MILVTPAVFTHVHPPLGSLIAIGWSLLTGRAVKVPVPYPLDLLTDQVDYLSCIKSDPLCLSGITGRSLYEAFKARRALIGSTGRFNIPVFVVLASRDKLVDTPQTRTYFHNKGGAYTIRDCMLSNSAMIGSAY